MVHLVDYRVIHLSPAVHFTLLLLDKPHSPIVLFTHNFSIRSNMHQSTKRNVRISLIGNFINWTHETTKFHKQLHLLIMNLNGSKSETVRFRVLLSLSAKIPLKLARSIHITNQPINYQIKH